MNGAVMFISHTFLDGSKHRIAYASHTLTVAEQNYCQLEKEALTLLFGVKRLHELIYSQTSDYKTLATILGPKKSIPRLSAMLGCATVSLPVHHQGQFQPKPHKCL